MIPVDPNRTATVWPLASLFDALRREGFQLRPDDYIEVNQVLDTFQPKSYADLQALIAPLLVISDQEQEKFDRIFERVRQLGGIEPPPPPPVYPFNRLIAALLIVLVVGYVAFLWPGPTFKTDLRLLKPVGPIEIGDTLVFSVDSSMQRAAGSRARWQWETAEGKLYPKPNGSELQMVARQAGPLIVKVRGQRGKGLLFTSWTDSVRSIEIPVCAKLPLVKIDSVRLSTSPLRYRFSARLIRAVPSWQRTNWQLNDAVVANNQTTWEHTFKAGSVPAVYDIRFTGYPDTTQQLCFGEDRLAVDVPGQTEPSFTLNVQSRGSVIVPITHLRRLYLWGIWLASELIMLLVGYYWGLTDRHFPEQSINPVPKPKPKLLGAWLAGILLILFVGYYLGIVNHEPVAPGGINTLLAFWLAGGLLTLLVSYYFGMTEHDSIVTFSTTSRIANPLAPFVSDKPPLEIPFENRDRELVTLDQAFYRTVRLFRQPAEGEIRRLHIGQTMQATMREGGLPTLIYQPHLAETEYLFLIDQSQVRSQQVALFEFLFQAFIRENVCVERFFFHKTFDRFTNETHPKGLSIRQLIDSYKGHTLIIWGNGYPLLYPPYPVVEPLIRDALADWTVRAILTPVPFADWGSKELALQADFVLLPADLVGQLRLMQALAEKQTNQDVYLEQHDQELYSTDYVDFRSVAGLKRYLGEDLVQWLAALAIYPRIRWEVVVEMGRALLPPEAVNFTNLLKLARISWMQEGSLPDKTRLELLKTLRPDNEVKARETLLRMLNKAEQYFPGDHFYDSEKFLVQTASQFALYAYDPKIYAEYQPAQQVFKTLYEQGQYPDGAMLRYLENPDGDWTTLLPTTHSSFTSESLGGQSQPTPLLTYLADMPAPSEAEPLEKPVSRKKTYLLAAIGAAFLCLLGLLYSASKPRNQEVDPDQQIPISISLDSSLCVTARNTANSAYNFPRWTFFLNDSLLSISNLQAMRSLPLRNLIIGSPKPPADSVILQATFSVNDTLSGAGRQYSSIQFSRDTLRIRIGCPDSPPATPKGSIPTVYIQYAARTQASEAQQLQIRLNTGGFRVPGIELRDTFRDSTQVRYFADQDQSLADSVATVVKSILKLRTVPVVKVSGVKKAPIEVWLNTGGATNPLKCKTIPVSWFTKFNKWQAADKRATYHLVVDAGVSLAVEVAGRIQSYAYFGSVRRICEQSNAYLIQTSKGDQAFLVRKDRALMRTSCNIALVTLNTNLLNGPEGQNYVDKLIGSAEFRRYELPDQPKEKQYEAGTKEPKPAGEYKVDVNQAAIPAPSTIEKSLIQSLQVNDTYVAQGVKAAQQGAFDEAINQYNLALEKNPNNASALVFKGYALFKLKRFDEAVNSLLIATKADPKGAWAYYNLAIAYCAMGKSSEANRARDQAIRLQPNLLTIMQTDREFRSFCGAGEMLK